MTGSPIPEREPVYRDHRWWVEEDGRVIRGGPYLSEADAVAAIAAWHDELAELYEAVEERARREGGTVAWGPPESFA